MWKFAFWLFVLSIPSPFALFQWTRMWSSDQYGYLPVVPLIFGALFSLRWDRQLRLPSTRGAITLTCIGLVAALVATIRYSPWLGSFGWVLVVGGFLSAHHSGPSQSDSPSWFASFKQAGSDSSLVMLWPLVWFAIPLPFNLDALFSARLANVAAKMASYVIDALGIAHRVSSSAIELEGLEVSLRSVDRLQMPLLWMLFAASSIAIVLSRTIWLQPIYILSGALWSLVVNSLIIVLAICCRAWYQIDVTLGSPSLVIVVALVLVWLGLYFSCDRLIRVLFFPTRPDPLVQRPNPFVGLWNRLFDNFRQYSSLS